MNPSREGYVVKKTITAITTGVIQKASAQNVTRKDEQLSRKKGNTHQNKLQNTQNGPQQRETCCEKDY